MTKKKLLGEYLCYFTNKPVSLRELLQVDIKIHKLYAQSAATYECFNDAIKNLYPSYKTRYRQGPYVHLNKTVGEKLINVCLEAYNKAVAKCESNEAKSSKKEEYYEPDRLTVEHLVPGGMETDYPRTRKKNQVKGWTPGSKPFTKQVVKYAAINNPGELKKIAKEWFDLSITKSQAELSLKVLKEHMRKTGESDFDSDFLYGIITKSSYYAAKAGSLVKPGKKKNAARKLPEFKPLIRISDEDDAKKWIEAYLDFDTNQIDYLEQEFEYEDDLKEQRKVMKEVEDALKELRFKSLKDMIGYHDTETEYMSIPDTIPYSPFDNSGKILPGWKKSDDIKIMSIIDGHRHEETISGYVKGEYALVKTKEYQKAMY